MSDKRNYCLLIVAATGSGIGKTSITSGLIFNLRNKGYKVQPFKIGPDFLDPSWLSIAAGKPCCNIDSWMTSPDYVVKYVHEQMQNSDIGIIEGVMGLYDGASTETLSGSTAEISRLLNAPVILIVNAHGASRSFAATVYGFVNFPDAPQIAGVIANHTGSDKHKDILSKALSSVNLPPLFGVIQRNSLPQIPGRHLGLVTATTISDNEKCIRQISKVCEQSIEIESIIASASIFKPSPMIITTNKSSNNLEKKIIRIAYAFDDAFHFYYSDNLNLLKQFGADLIPFSPLMDSVLPENIAGLYIGGGYPEEFASQLSNNTSMIRSVYSFAHSNNSIYAECGGLMYLSKSIKDRQNEICPMVNVLPFETVMGSSFKTLGYCDVILTNDCIIGKKGAHYKGHEFHYSQIANSVDDVTTQCFQITYRNGCTITSGYATKNILASYIHLHWGETPEAASIFIQSCRTGVSSNENF